LNSSSRRPICDTQWRLERARNLETNLIALAHLEEIPAIAAIEDPGQRAALITAHGYDKRERTLQCAPKPAAWNSGGLCQSSCAK